jgi:hypothetical protein
MLTIRRTTTGNDTTVSTITLRTRQIRNNEVARWN